MNDVTPGGPNRKAGRKEVERVVRRRCLNRRVLRAPLRKPSTPGVTSFSPGSEIICPICPVGLIFVTR